MIDNHSIDANLHGDESSGSVIQRQRKVLKQRNNICLVWISLDT